MSKCIVPKAVWNQMGMGNTKITHINEPIVSLKENQDKTSGFFIFSFVVVYIYLTHGLLRWLDFWKYILPCIGGRIQGHNLWSTFSLHHPFVGYLKKKSMKKLERFSQSIVPPPNSLFSYSQTFFVFPLLN